MRDYLLLHLVILAWGFTAILGKLITLPAWDVVIWRTFIAALGFGLLARVLHRPLRTPRGDALKMAAIGAILGLHWLLFFYSARLATASVSLAALPTAMLWCSLMEPFVDGSRRWRPLELLVGGIIVAAVWMIYEVELRYWAGFSVGIGAAFLAAIYAVASKQWVARQHYAVLGFYQMLGALLVTGTSALLSGNLPALPNLPDSLWLLLLSTVCTVGAYAGYMAVLRRLSVFTVNVVYNLEPVYGIILAVLIFGSQEHMSGGFYTGAAIITGSVVILPWLRTWVERPQAPPVNPG